MNAVFISAFNALLLSRIVKLVDAAFEHAHVIVHYLIRGTLSASLIGTRRAQTAANVAVVSNY